MSNTKEKTGTDPYAFERDGYFGVQLGPGHSQSFGQDRDKRDAYLAELLAASPCRECGRHFERTYCEPTKSQMIERQLCFGCNFWTNILNQKDRHVFINGTSYQIAKDSPPGQRNYDGFGGREFIVRFNDGRVVMTHNLWHQGTIPDHFKDRLPDTAAFEQKPKPVGHRQGYLGSVGL